MFDAILNDADSGIYIHDIAAALFVPAEKVKEVIFSNKDVKKLEARNNLNKKKFSLKSERSILETGIKIRTYLLSMLEKNGFQFFPPIRTYNKKLQSVINNALEAMNLNIFALVFKYNKYFDKVMRSGRPITLQPPYKNSLVLLDFEENRNFIYENIKEIFKEARYIEGKLFDKFVDDCDFILRNTLQNTKIDKDDFLLNLKVQL